MLSFDEALELVNQLSVPVHTESVELDQAYGRVLAQPVLASNDQPPFDRATMDGYAVALAPGVTSYRVIDTILAGAHFEGTLQAGEAVRIMTGAPCPGGATVVAVERTNGGEAEVLIEPEALEPGKNIAWKGQDARRGQTILASGLRLAPQTLSVAPGHGRGRKGLGSDRLLCYQNPSVGIVTTGDEIGAEGPAGVRNSNGPYLASLCTALGLERRCYHAKDEREKLAATLAQAASEHEVVVTVGGVSMGTVDLVPQTAEALGFRTLFHRVAMQPGKPVFLAQRADGKLLLGLPGNPVSVLVTAHLFLMPVLGRFQGGWQYPWQTRALAEDLEHKGTRRLFLPARLGSDGVVPVRWNGSGDFFAAAQGDGLLDLQPGGVWKRGHGLRFLPYWGHTPGETGLAR
ncbi:MAG TPA: molybdopterin molybdotransferase MoeA [Planctomycetota bacterium]|nr:molybdopterin molybdotransferase MoeA [Planctomycetota bacterium]